MYLKYNFLTDSDVNGIALSFDFYQSRVFKWSRLLLSSIKCAYNLHFY